MCRAADDHGAAAAPAFEQSFAGQDHVRAESGVPIDADVRGQVPRGWKTCTGPELAGRHEQAQLIDELLVHRCRSIGCDAKIEDARGGRLGLACARRALPRHCSLRRTVSWMTSPNPYSVPTVRLAQFGL